LEKALRRGFYDDAEDATHRALRRKAALERAPEPGEPQLDLLSVADGYIRAVPETGK
jgi:DNA sulfur modification protein DndC